MGDGADRELWRAAVREYVRPQLEQRCDLCRERFERNVLRVLDCKNPRCVELNAGAPVLVDFLSAANREHFDAVRAALGALGREAVIDPRIVRGLDYYTRTIFELHYPQLGARSALCGGGRYDHLVRDLGGPDVPAVGFAVGFSSTLLVLEELGLAKDLALAPVDVFVLAVGAEFQGDALRLAQSFRDGGLSAVFDTEGRSFKAQMKLANAGGHPLVAILGSDERAAGGVQLKDMRSGEQNLVPLGEIVARARAALGRS
jgi:histidyl-tRNA synthetase